MVKINITFDCFTLQKYAITSAIKQSIQQTLALQGFYVPCEINVLVTNDAGIQAINLASRQIDKPTDVLSFPMFQFEPGILPDDWSGFTDPESNTCPLGDIAISLERAITQAKEYGHSTRREVGYLTIHSMLHLLGYDHLDEGEQKKAMREREEFIASHIRGMQR